MKMGNGMETANKAQDREGAPRWLLALAAMMLIMLVANGIMVWLSLRGHRDLVRPDYYDAGLDQDGTMARTDLSLAPGMEVSFLRDASGWRVETAAEGLRTATCRVLLYRPDNKGEDQILELGSPRTLPGTSGRIFWTGSNPTLRRGHWQARLVWEVDGKAVMEKPYRIYIP